MNQFFRKQQKKENYIRDQIGPPIIKKISEVFQETLRNL